MLNKIKKAMTKILTSILALTFFMSGFAQHKTFFINSQQKDCTGVGPMKCLQYKEIEDGAWKLMYQVIEGFEFEPGYLYTIKVKQTKVKNPPADGSSIRYTLKKIVSKVKDTNMEATTSRSPEGKWLITSLVMEGKLTDISAKAFELEFKEAGNQVSTKICNMIRGGYTMEGSNVKFGPMASTKMMCPDMNYEASFNQAIMQVDNIAYERNRMYLKKGNETLIILTMPVK
jgi:heat shock protein HslJ